MSLPEVLGKVCSYLDMQDVSNFRLCCKAFADVGLRFAYRKVVMFLDSKFLDMLRYISLHTVASTSVKSLVYIVDPTMLIKKPLDRAKSQGRPRLRRIVGGVPDPRSFFFTELHVTFDPQHQILQRNTDISCIEEAGCRFPALEEIIVSSRRRYGASAANPPTYIARTLMMQKTAI